MSFLPDWFINIGIVTLTVIMLFFLLFVVVVCLCIGFMAIRDWIGWLQRRRRR